MAVMVTELMDSSSSDEDNELPQDQYAHTRGPRGSRAKFKHEEALNSVMRDYLGAEAIFSDKQFQLMFRLTRPRMQRLMEDIMNGPPNICHFLRVQLIQHPIHPLRQSCFCP